MPGYTCKIVIEDTHPPVWRRVIIPDQITFFELHKIIQILFDWDDVHLHGFHIPSDDIVIDDEGGFDLWGIIIMISIRILISSLKITNGSATSMILEMNGVTRSI